ncbi:hypothetical protein [Janthinobacterium sp.]|uniref:hypothetical protein n=1 Tax=Janthinobacterium sp. TaxID=1871054 RepID=UPI00293D21FF|nr:hypothetical protein [Janthinobacterium sp.]
MAKLFVVLIAALLAACAAVESKKPGDELAGTWFNPSAEFPAMCMTFAPGGTLGFAGGFVFYNPGRWFFDSARAELRIELGGSMPFPAEAARQQIQRRAGNLLRAEPAHRALVYRLTPATETLELGGFVFYRKLACELTLASKG